MDVQIFIKIRTKKVPNFKSLIVVTVKIKEQRDQPHHFFWIH